MIDTNTIEISGEILHDTDFAILFTDGITETWLPKSQIEIEPEFYDYGDNVIVSMPKWLAYQKELI